ncbi:MAG: TerC family protein [Betaproteobacteria bacterium]
MEIGFFVALMQIMMVNVVLSGDNAVVIALAARNLPPKLKKQAVLWGCGGAVGLRIVMSLIAVQLLKIPFLQFFGALLLVWIALKLLIEEDHDEGPHHAHSNLLGAIKTIIIADVLMSLDNTLAIAGVAKGDQTLVMIGLALSVPLIVFGSTIIMKLMDRFPSIVYIGAGLITWTSGVMIEDDKAMQPYLPSIFLDTPWLPALITVAVLAYGWWFNKQSGRSAHDVLVADEHAATRLEDQID